MWLKPNAQHLSVSNFKKSFGQWSENSRVCFIYSFKQSRKHSSFIWSNFTKMYFKNIHILSTVLYFSPFLLTDLRKSTIFSSSRRLPSAHSTDRSSVARHLLLAPRWPSPQTSAAVCQQPCQRTPRWRSESTAMSRSPSPWLTFCPWSIPWTIRAARWVWVSALDLQPRESLCCLIRKQRTVGPRGTISWSTSSPRWASLWVWETFGGSPTCARRTVEVGGWETCSAWKHYVHVSTKHG